MAQYLSLGADDREAAMWLRDAVRFDLLPKRASQAARAFSPYRYGSAMWAYLAGRFGDRVIAEVLSAAGARHIGAANSQGDGRRAGTAVCRLARRRVRNLRPSICRRRPDDDPSPLLRDAKAGRLQLGPSLSPDGRDAIFFSERDRLSLDLFLADTTTGAITRKLATTTATARFESLQADSIRRLVESGAEIGSSLPPSRTGSLPSSFWMCPGLAAIGRSSFRNSDRS